MSTCYTTWYSDHRQALVFQSGRVRRHGRVHQNAPRSWKTVCRLNIVLGWTEFVGNPLYCRLECSNALRRSRDCIFANICRKHFIFVLQNRKTCELSKNTPPSKFEHKLREEFDFQNLSPNIGCFSRRALVFGLDDSPKVVEKARDQFYRAGFVFSFPTRPTTLKTVQ